MKIASLEPFEYVCKCDRDEPRDKQTTFFLRPLRYVEKVECVHESGGSEGEAIKLLFPNVLKRALIGWKNFDGAPEFRPGDPTMLDYVDNVIPELAAEVLKRAQNSEADIKN